MELTEKTYQLININTGEKHICTKINIDGFDYYVKEDNKFDTSEWVIENGKLHLFNSKRIVKDCLKVIATTNPDIDAPKVIVIDKVQELATQTTRNKYPVANDDYPIAEAIGFHIGYCSGYNKHAKTHSNSDEHMIAFNEWCENNYERVDNKKDSALWQPNSGNRFWYVPFTDEEFKAKKGKLTSQELLKIWKAQQTPVIYFK